VIRRRYVYMVEKLDVKHSDLLDHLVQKRVLDQCTLDEIRTEATSRRQTEKLLSEINRGSNENFEQFLEALDECDQKHVADNLRSGRPINYRLLNLPERAAACATFCTSSQNICLLSI